MNMFELGLLSPDEENIRITGFDVQYMEAHTVGNVGMSTYMDIDLVHSGLSKFRKNGEVFWFNHISRQTQNPHPNTWSIRYNPLTQWRDRPDYDNFCRETLELLIAEAAEGFEILPLEQDLDLLRNIIYSGVWQRYQLISERKHRKEDAHAE